MFATNLTFGFTCGFWVPYAEARPGQGMSIGSRGHRTWQIPTPTRTSPHITAPIERSMMPRVPPSTVHFSNPMRFTPPQSRVPYQNRHPFLTGFVGGFLGAGLFGLLSGHGLVGGLHGFLSFIGFLIQIGLVVVLIMWLIKRFRLKTNTFTVPQQRGTISQITAADYQSFQKILMDIQTAWNQQDIPAMQHMATPEMVAYFREQLSTLTREGLRNIVSDVRFLQGDLSEAWVENGTTYATVAMRYSLVDLTTDVLGQVVHGSSTHPTTVTEVWTFVRPSNQSQWFLSALQQTR